VLFLKENGRSLKMIPFLLIDRRRESSIATTGLLAITVLLFTLLPAQSQPAVVPEKDIASTLIRQFDSLDLVGLGELHGSRADQELRIKIIHHKDFARKVHNVVMEGLNSLHQEDLDRYLRGEDVPKERVQRVWRDSTQIFAGPTMLTTYEQFLREVRLVNQSLPDNLKIRVIAADPPIDWVKVQSREDFVPFLRNRVDFGAEVIAREVLRKRKKALLVFGMGHFTRNQQMKTPSGFIPLIPTIGWLIDKQFPGRLYVVTPSRGGVYRDTLKLEGLIGTSALPVLLRLKGTAFGVLNPNEFIPANPSILLGAPEPPFHPFRDGIGMADVADALIYRGRTVDAIVLPDPSYAADTAYAAELRRRAGFAP
jgi:hypothetical protein